MEPEKKEKIYYGTIPCQGKTTAGLDCANKAYWECKTSGGKRSASYLCGVHSKKIKTRKELPYDSQARVRRLLEYKDREVKVEQARLKYERMEKKGHIICDVMKMRKEAPHKDGYLKVFPNFLHGKREDGYGCSSLSPKSLGPVLHSEYDMPEAKNIENYHQAAKIYPWEIDAKGTLIPGSIQVIKNIYKDPIPHRHKFTAADKGKALYAIRFDIHGKMHKFDPIQLRYFYCYYYALLAKKQEQFHELVKLWNSGTNLQITGYDGYPLTKPLIEHYKDASKPYGHERVLATLLLVENPKDYPWEIYRREYPELYEGFNLD